MVPDEPLFQVDYAFRVLLILKIMKIRAHEDLKHWLFTIKIWDQRVSVVPLWNLSVLFGHDAYFGTWQTNLFWLDRPDFVTLTPRRRHAPYLSFSLYRCLPRLWGVILCFRRCHAFEIKSLSLLYCACMCSHGDTRCFYIKSFRMLTPTPRLVLVKILASCHPSSSCQRT